MDVEGSLSRREHLRRREHVCVEVDEQWRRTCARMTAALSARARDARRGGHRRRRASRSSSRCARTARSSASTCAATASAARGREQAEPEPAHRRRGARAAAAEQRDAHRARPLVNGRGRRIGGRAREHRAAARWEPPRLEAVWRGEHPALLRAGQPRVQLVRRGRGEAAGSAAQALGPGEARARTRALTASDARARDAIRRLRGGCRATRCTHVSSRNALTGNALRSARDGNSPGRVARPRGSRACARTAAARRGAARRDHEELRHAVRSSGRG